MNCDLRMFILSAIYVVTASAGFLLAFVTTAYLISFLSYVPSTNTEETQVNKSLRWTIGKDVLLLLFFIIQHSLMKHWLYKRMIMYLRLEILERSIYIIATSLVLLCVMTLWERIPLLTLWHFNTSNFIIWLSFAFLHGLMWLVIYGGTIIMDVCELLGMKQVMHYLCGWEHPMKYKSAQLCRLYRHVRHPSLSAFFIIFWGNPVMSLDRFLLAFLWSIYMIAAWKADTLDYEYQCKQLNKKARALRLYS